MGVPAVVVVVGAGAGRCCWMAARGGGAEQGSVLGMRRLKSHRCQTAGQKSGRWPSGRAAGLGRGSATLASLAAAQRGPRPLPPETPYQQKPPPGHPAADPLCNPAGPTRAKSCEMSAGISDTGRSGGLQVRCTCGKAQRVNPCLALNGQCLCCFQPQTGLGVQQACCG